MEQRTCGFGRSHLQKLLDINEREGENNIKDGKGKQWATRCVMILQLCHVEMKFQCVKREAGNGGMEM